MRYALLFEHKTNLNQRGLVDFYGTEALALQAANDNAKKAEYNFFVCPMQTLVAAEMQITTTVLADTVTTTAVTATAAPTSTVLL